MTTNASFLLGFIQTEFRPNLQDYKGDQTMNIAIFSVSTLEVGIFNKVVNYRNKIN